MRIIIYSFEGKHRLGGVARHCVELGTALRQSGYDVEFPLDALQFAPEDERIVTSRQTPPPRDLVRAFFALREVDRGDTVICSQWYPEGLLAILAGIRPKVTLAHGSELMPSHANWRRVAWRWLRGQVFARSSSVVLCSTYSRDLLLESHPEVNAIAVPLGVDHTRFTPGDSSEARAHFDIDTPYVISSVSRLYEFKGYETVFRALATLPPEVRDHFTYIIAGTGPDRPTLERKAAELGVARHVRWLGYVAERDLPLVYRASNLFVLMTREDPSRQEVEGFGFVFAEAQACGIPVVGSRTGGIPDAVEEHNGGWLIDQHDADELGRILRHLDDDPARFARMGVRARRRVESDFTWSAYIKRFLAVTGLSFDDRSGAAPSHEEVAPLA